MVSGFRLIQREIESDPTRPDFGRIQVKFFSQIGLDFVSEKFHRFGFGFGSSFDFVTGLDLDLDSISCTGWDGFRIH